MATTRIWDKDNEYILAFKRSVAGNQSCLPLVKYMLSILIGLATYPKKIMKNKILCGDSLEVLKDFENNYFDSVVTDPPYGISFMSKSWDYDVPQVELWKEVYRVLKPGGHILSFAGSRTYHRMAVNIEDAGFEIRDMLGWLYGSGFPKSHNVGKAVDKLQGRNSQKEIEFVEWLKTHNTFSISEIDKRLGTKSQAFHYFAKSSSNRQIPTNKHYEIIKELLLLDDTYDSFIENKNKRLEEIREIQGYDNGIKNWNKSYKKPILDKPKTEEAKQWEGWGTALKPAHEPIVMARKPFKTSVAENVLTHGTGGINIDECRVGTDEKIKFERKKESTTASGWKDVNRNPYEQHNKGRFPANIIHDGSEEVLEIFPETKQAKSRTIRNFKGWKNEGNLKKHEVYKDDSNSASRFFYCAKASKAERNMGLDDYEEKPMGMSNRAKHRSTLDHSHDIDLNRVINRKNYHPTVKPIKLMEYLVRLVTPKKGIVLEPFAGSGTTLIACKQQGFNYIGIEREQEYCDIAEARLKGVKIQGTLF